MNKMKTVLCALLILSTAAVAKEKEDEAIRKRVADFQDAWNKHDAKAITAFWAEDGDLINPAGVVARGKAEVEKLVVSDLANIIRDGKTTFTVTYIRMVKPDVAVFDMTHEISEAHAPDGSVIPTVKAMVTGVALKKDGTWWWLAGRPMIPFAPPAPPASK